MSASQPPVVKITIEVPVGTEALTQPPRAVGPTKDFRKVTIAILSHNEGDPVSKATAFAVEASIVYDSGNPVQGQQLKGWLLNANGQTHNADLITFDILKAVWAFRFMLAADANFPAGQNVVVILTAYDSQAHDFNGRLRGLSVVA